MKIGCGGRSLTVGLHPGFNLAGLHGAGLLGDHFTVFKHHQHRNRADCILGGGFLRLFRVQFGKSVVGFQIARRLGKFRPHHFARAAPFGPEIHHDWNGIFGNETGEICIGQLNRFARKERGFALAALGRIGRFVVGNPVDCRAGGAGYLVGHSLGPLGGVIVAIQIGSMNDGGKGRVCFAMSCDLVIGPSAAYNGCCLGA